MYDQISIHFNHKISNINLIPKSEIMKLLVNKGINRKINTIQNVDLIFATYPENV